MISIALATYNGHKYIREQIDSILAQSYTDFELVICDDCSSDNTFEILKEYEKKDNRIHVFKNEKNLGFKKNFEHICSLCRGDFIAFSDQDDLWEKEKLAISISYIKDYDFVCTNALIVDSENRSTGLTMMDYLDIKKMSSDKTKIFKRLLYANVVQGSTMVIKRAFLEKYLPIPENFKFHDWYFAFMSCLENGFYYIETPLLRYRQHSDNVTKNEYKKNVFIKLHQIFDYKNNRANAIQNIEYIKNYPLPEEMKKDVEPVEKFLENQFTLYAIKFMAENYEIIKMDKSKVNKFIRVSKYIIQTIIYKLFYKKHKH